MQPTAREATPASAGPRRRTGCECDRAELRTCQEARVGRMLGHLHSDQLAEWPEQLGARLEAVLVEVVPRALTGTQQEVALEVGVLAQRRAQLVPSHRHRCRISRASGRSRAASAEPFASETIEPSS